jgi:hypothetical protein
LTSPASPAPAPPAGPEPELVPDAESLLGEAAGHIRAIAAGAGKGIEEAVAWVSRYGL